MAVKLLPIADPVQVPQTLHGVATSVTVVTWIFTALCTVFFVMSSISRLYIQRLKFTWQDAIIALSWALNIVRSGFFQRGLTASRQIRPDNLEVTIPKTVFWLNLADSFSFFTIALPKVAIGLLLISIFRPRPSVKWAINILSVGLLIVSLVGFIISMVQCSPPAYLWSPYKHPGGHCWPVNAAIAYAIVTGSYSALVDLVFAIYPGVVIWGLQMPRWKRLSTMLLMSLGFACFAIAVTKIYYMTQLLGHPSVYARLWFSMDMGIWISTENSLVIITGCLPFVPPFFRWCFSFVQKHTHSGWRKFRALSHLSDSSEKALEKEDTDE